MKCFTITDGSVAEGIATETITAGSGDTYHAITLGERGRGRYEAVIPITGNALSPEDRIEFAESGQTRSGKPLIRALAAPTTSEKCLVAFRTGIGFRGGNSHTGGRVSNEEQDRPYGGPAYQFRDFPGEILATGTIAQGQAGGSGSGEQHLAIMPANTWFRVRRTGRLYGSEGCHYYYFDGTRIKGYTPDDAENIGLDLSSEVAP